MNDALALVGALLSLVGSLLFLAAAIGLLRFPTSIPAPMPPPRRRPLACF